jgi:hypothetical protein
MLSFVLIYTFLFPFIVQLMLDVNRETKDQPEQLNNIPTRSGSQLGNSLPVH